MESFKGRNNFEENTVSSLFDTEAVIHKEFNTSTTYRVFIDGPIGENTTYRNLIGVLNSAGEQDIVHMLINSPGGSVDVALQIYMAMTTTLAHVIVQVDGLAASAATFFIMVADQVLLSPHAYIMCHGASMYAGGDMATLKSDVDFNYNRCLKIAMDIYEGFMTEEEIIDMIKNHRDINMTTEEVLERLQAREERKRLKLLEETSPPKKRTTRKNIKKGNEND